ncbi:MAG: PTS sugar transporter subunit IIC [Chloroflexi bacterium]|nr:PTS sugar transporter subunit IIC [Chloroflexota bacterium]
MVQFFAGLQSILSELGATVVLPIIIFILGLVLGAKPGRAFRSGVTIGVAFVGINLVIGLMWTNLSNAAQAIVERTGAALTVVDVGWPSAAAIAFASTVGTYIIPISIAVNIIMLALNATKTLNVDVWNFWHFAFTGAMIVAATGNLPLGLAAAAVNAAIVLFLADWTAPGIQSFFGMPGLSIPHGFSAAYVPVAIPLNWVLSKIPGLKDLEADPDAIQQRLGVIGEPVILGLVIGIVLGLIAFFNPAALKDSIVKTLQTGINLSAVMLLLPRMVGILMEGLLPLSDAAREFMQKRYAGREIYVGLDSAILIGHPAAIAASLVLVPITILLAVILPGNKVLPFADLAVIPFLVCMTAPITRGNVVRIIIIGTIVIAIGFYIGTAGAELFTRAAVDAKFSMPAGATQISSICDGFNFLTFVLMAAARALSFIGVLVILAILIVVIAIYRRNAKAWEIAAGGPSE